MNKQQAVKADISAKQYLEKHKLRSLFAELTKEVVLKRPDDPFAHLIDFISKRNKKQIICIQGYHDEHRNKISLSVANKFNFCLINLSTILGHKDYHFKSNEQINSIILSEIKKIDSIYKGVVISGFPNNAVQADFIQKSGTLPDRYFLLTDSEETIKEIYEKNYDPENVELLLKRNALEAKELLQNLSDKVDFLPSEPQKAIEKINNAINIKFRKVVPYDSPRVLVLHPPFLKPRSIQALSNKFSLNLISVESSFKKLSEKEDFKNYVESHIRKTKQLSKEIELAIIETECKSAASKNKGYILTGWPYKRHSIPLIKQQFLSPHLILIFNSIKERAFEQFNLLEPTDPHFAILEKPSLEDYQKLYKEYESVVEILRNNSNVQLLSLSQTDNQVIKTFESLIENPQIYS